jgi:hypothetical protein
VALEVVETEIVDHQEDIKAMAREEANLPLRRRLRLSLFLIWSRHRYECY